MIDYALNRGSGRAKILLWQVLVNHSNYWCDRMWQMIVNISNIGMAAAIPCYQVLTAMGGPKTQKLVNEVSE